LIFEVYDIIGVFLLPLYLVYNIMIDYNDFEALNILSYIMVYRINCCFYRDIYGFSDWWIM